MLALTLKQVLETDIARWQDEVQEGVLSEQARQVFTALGWITQRDPRVIPQSGATSAPTVRAVSPPATDQAWGDEVVVEAPKKEGVKPK